MRNNIRFLLKDLIIIYQLSRIWFSQKSYLRSMGYINSIKKGIPVNYNNEPVPWMNYHVVFFLEKRLNRNLSMFEYGSGYSTLYFQKLVKSIKSVEYNKDWFDKISKIVENNVEIIFCNLDTNGNYAKSILASNAKFDIIIIDGGDRMNCIEYSVNALNESGIILLDDSQRPSYKTGFEYLKKQGFKEITFSGLKPGTIEMYNTTIFYRGNNVLNI